VLADAGIVDYGCVRQFGLRYDEYRYEDVDRMSPSLSEQPDKLKLVVQSFVQAVDFVQHGTRRPIEKFASHQIVRRYWKSYADCRLLRILFYVGFDDSNACCLVLGHRKEVEKFAAEYDAIESVQTAGPIQKVPDGVNRKPLLNLRNLLRAYPDFLLKQHDFEAASLSSKAFFDMLFVRGIGARDRGLARDHEQRVAGFQHCYKQLVARAAERESLELTLNELRGRSQIINAADRATGNAVTNIAERLLVAREAGLSVENLGKLIDGFVESQRLDPDQPRAEISEHPQGGAAERVRREMLSLLEAHSEDV